MVSDRSDVRRAGEASGHRQQVPVADSRSRAQEAGVSDQRADIDPVGRLRSPDSAALCERVPEPYQELAAAYDQGSRPHADVRTAGSVRKGGGGLPVLNLSPV